jgi:hypothetical protein
MAEVLAFSGSSSLVCPRVHVANRVLSNLLVPRSAFHRHVDSGIGFYIGFGSNGGSAAIHRPGQPMGASRKLGVNELLLHYDHGEDDLIVQCR